MATKKIVPSSASYYVKKKTSATVFGIYGRTQTVLSQQLKKHFGNKMEVIDFRVPVEGDQYIRKALEFGLTPVIGFVKPGEKTFAVPSSPRLIVKEAKAKKRIIFENPQELDKGAKVPAGSFYSVEDKAYRGIYCATNTTSLAKSYYAAPAVIWERREEEYYD